LVPLGLTRVMLSVSGRRSVPPDLQAATQSREEKGRERPPLMDPFCVPVPAPGSLTPQGSVSVSGDVTRAACRREIDAGHCLNVGLFGENSGQVLEDERLVLLRVIAIAPTSNFRARSAASRLRSLRSPLRGLDPSFALPFRRAIVGATAAWHSLVGSRARPPTMEMLTDGGQSQTRCPPLAGRDLPVTSACSPAC
jgi:hypothetical protein